MKKEIKLSKNHLNVLADAIFKGNCKREEEIKEAKELNNNARVELLQKQIDLTNELYQFISTPGIKTAIISIE